MALKYKVIHGYEVERHMPIDADELEKAYKCFLHGGRAVFRNGAIDSKYIQAIVPDFHATMGWTAGYKLGVDDYAELSSKGVDRKLRDFQNEVKEAVQNGLPSPQLKISSPLIHQHE